MKYTVTLYHYISGSGFQFREDVETGNCYKQFTATEWINDADIEIEDNEWIETEVKFYADDADPMFDDPIATSIDNETICGKI